MNRRFAAVSGLALVWFLASLVSAPEAAGQSFRVRLQGYEEVPAVSTGATGAFRAKVDGAAVSWSLSYEDLEGSVTQAHIHFGQVGVLGGISVFLCTNLGNGPVGTQLCPASPTTISGTFLAGDVVGPGGQGIAAGQFDELLAAIRAGVAYVNVHSTLWPGGEIRGQF
jgi:hypothetical protein